MNIYNKILNNQEYLALTEKIGKMKFITDGKWDWEHGLGYYKRVSKYVKKNIRTIKCHKKRGGTWNGYCFTS